MSLYATLTNQLELDVSRISADCWGGQGGGEQCLYVSKFRSDFSAEKCDKESRILMDSRYFHYVKGA